MLVRKVIYTHLKPVIVDEIGKLLLSGMLSDNVNMYTYTGYHYID